MDVLLGTVTGPAAFTGLLCQWGWIGVMALCCRALWNAGAHKYLAAGG